MWEGFQDPKLHIRHPYTVGAQAGLQGNCLKATMHRSLPTALPPLLVSGP